MTERKDEGRERGKEGEREKRGRKRGRGEDREEEEKRGTINLGSNQLFKCSPQPSTPKEIHRV